MRILLAGATFFTGVLQTFADPLLPSATAADTTHAIQAAIDAAGSGGTVTLGAGTFEIDAQLMVTNCVTLVGQGWDSTIIKQTASGNDKRCATVDGNAKLQCVTLTGGCINGNNSSGGGVNIKNGTVSWCCITNNTAGVSNGSSVYGGGVGFYQGKGRVDHSIIEGNLVNSTTALGGGIGIYQPTGAITIDTCLVVGNAATGKTAANGKGGGIYLEYMYWYADVTIRNSTIAGNSASGTTLGGGLYVTGDSDAKGTHTILMNDIMAGNTSASVANDAVISKTDKTSYCLFGLDDEKVGVGSKSGNPAFVNAANGDYHLSANSPAGSMGTTYTGIGVDLDNITFANPPAVGCYEYANRIAEPVFDPASGATFYPSTNVTLACATENATIYYTTDGTDPTDASTEYTAPIAISTTTTIKAIAYKQGIDPSAIVSATYTYEEPPPPPPEGVIVPGETPAETTETIQAAIDAAANLQEPGMVTLGNGLFEINAQLMVTGGVTLAGQGWDNTIIKQTTTTPSAETRCVVVDDGAKVERVTLTGARVTGPNGTCGGGALVRYGTISWCCITNNSITTANSKYGGGVYIAKGSIDHSIIANNSVSSQHGTCGGGGVGIYQPTDEILIDKCLIAGNAQSNGQGGAGLFVSFMNNHYRLTIRNTTIIGNEASGSGGGVFVAEYYAANKFSFAVVNSILADNVSRSENADPNLALPGDERIVSGYAAQSYNNLFANGTAALGTDSRSDAGSGSAWFVDAASGDYHLTATSPAKGAGMAYERIGVDLDNVAFANPPSIGCYEVPAQKKAGVIIFVH